MTTFTTITNPDFYDYILEDAQSGETDWSVSRHAKPGDCVLLYVTAPVSAIVAKAYVVEMPREEENPASTFCGLFFAEMEGLKMLAKPIERATLLAKFPTWKYWKQPRNSVEVPLPLVSRLDKLLDDSQ